MKKFCVKNVKTNGGDTPHPCLKTNEDITMNTKNCI